MPDSSFFLLVGVGMAGSAAFCWILDKLAAKFDAMPEDTSLIFDFIRGLGDELKAFGVFNMLLSNGDYLIAYCTNNLSWITRRAPFGQATLIDTDMVVDFHEETTPNDIVTVIATRPLTNNEDWHIMNSGECVMFKLGEKQHQHQHIPVVVAE